MKKINTDLEEKLALYFENQAKNSKTEDYIDNLAHQDYPYGSEASIGSGDRSFYEKRKLAFISGFKANQKKKGDYIRKKRLLIHL